MLAVVVILAAETKALTTLPLRLSPVAFKLPPLILPVALTTPPVLMLAPVMFPKKLAVPVLKLVNVLATIKLPYTVVLAIPYCVPMLMVVVAVLSNAPVPRLTVLKLLALVL